MPRSLFYSGVVTTLVAALIAMTRGLELLCNVEVIPWFERSTSGSILVMLALLTMAAFFLRISVAVLIRDLFSGIVASIAIVAGLLAELFRFSVAPTLSADAVLPLSYVSAFAVVLLLVAVRSYFTLRMGEGSWLMVTPALFFLGALLLELVLGYRSHIFYAPFLLGLGGSLWMAASYGLGHRRLFFESVSLRNVLSAARSDSLDTIALEG